MNLELFNEFKRLLFEYEIRSFVGVGSLETGSKDDSLTVSHLLLLPAVS